MSPTRTAIQIFKAWTHDRPEDKHFPVDCREIAKEFAIKVQGDDLGEEFEGGLFIQGKLKAIIYNERIREEGRKNFTIGHEFGHFFLHREKKELRCSLDNLTEFNSKPHPDNIEVEANCFSANLLMPTDDLRCQLKGRDINLDLAGILTDRYQTTLTAVSLRIVEVTHKPAALIVSKGGMVRWWRRNDAMAQCGLWLTRGQVLPSDATAGHRDGSIVDSGTWLTGRYADAWEIIQSVADMPSYNQTLILLLAASREAEEDWLAGVQDCVDHMLR
ncbi:MAG: ImmA/IrrE family metallo-endopeptidase [Acidobacteria bacterium]|nr:ImmA/IrrE family metallo-endopeptidase [Acidobacteriota bacterium]